MWKWSNKSHNNNYYYLCIMGNIWDYKKIIFCSLHPWICYNRDCYNREFECLSLDLIKRHFWITLSKPAALTQWLWISLAVWELWELKAQKIQLWAWNDSRQLRRHFLIWQGNRNGWTKIRSRFVVPGPTFEVTSRIWRDPRRQIRQYLKSKQIFVKIIGHKYDFVWQVLYYIL